MGKKVGERRDVCRGKAKTIISVLDRYESSGGLYHNYLRTGYHAPVIEKQKGIYLWDVEGNEYIDTTGGFCAVFQGYCPEEITEEVKKCMDTLCYLPEMPSPVRAQLAKEIVEIAPGELKEGKVQFELGGHSTVDLALQIAQFYAKATRKEYTRHLILSFFGAYHGRTALTSSVSSLSRFTQKFPVFTETIKVPYAYCYRCYYGLHYPECEMACIRYIQKLFESDLHGVYDTQTKQSLISTLIVEPLQDYAGMIIPPREFHPMLKKLCEDHKIVFIADEVPGFLHTGKWFSIEHWDVVPDIILTAKPLGGGFWPMGAVIARKEIMEVWEQPGMHFTTYMGNPIGCTAALINLRVIKEKNLLKKIEEVGNYFKQGLMDLYQRHKIIGDVSGLGGLLGIELVKDRKTKEPALTERDAFAGEALSLGVVVADAMGNTSRCLFIPPAIMTRKEIDIVMSVLDRSLEKVEKLYT